MNRKISFCGNYVLNSLYILRSKRNQNLQSYVLSSMDVPSLDLKEFTHGLSNVTCFRIFDHEDSRSKSYLADWKVKGTPDVNIPRTPQEISVSTYLLKTI